MVSKKSRDTYQSSFNDASNTELRVQRSSFHSARDSKMTESSNKLVSSGGGGIDENSNFESCLGDENDYQKYEDQEIVD